MSSFSQALEVSSSAVAITWKQRERQRRMECIGAVYRCTAARLMRRMQMRRFGSARSRQTVVCRAGCSGAPVLDRALSHLRRRSLSPRVREAHRPRRELGTALPDPHPPCGHRRACRTIPSVARRVLYRCAWNAAQRGAAGQAYATNHAAPEGKERNRANTRHVDDGGNFHPTLFPSQGVRAIPTSRGRLFFLPDGVR